MAFILLVAALCVLWPGAISATDVSIRQEFGRSSQALVLEEEEDDDRFSFWDTDLGFTQGDEKAKFHLDACRREKDYKTRNTDFSSNRIAVEAWRKYGWRGETVRAGALGGWRNKDFDRADLTGWRELRGGVFAEGLRNFDVRLLLYHYDYENGRNEDRLQARLGYQTLWRGINLSPSVAVQRHEAAGRLKFKTESQLSAYYEPELSWWSRIAVRVEGGQRDTKLLEEREDDLDYSFWEFEASSLHEVLQSHKLRWRAGAKEKDDKAGLFSHRGSWARAGWQWRFPVGRQKLTLEPFVSFKRMEFRERADLTYEKVEMGAEGSLLSWDEWRVDGMGRMDFYHFLSSGRRRERLSAQLSISRSFSEADVTLGGSLRHSLLQFFIGLSVKL